MAKRPIRPKREPMPTFGTIPDAARAVHEAIAPFDRLARDMESKWGVDRLTGLVDEAKAIRWGEVMDELDAAIAANDPQRAAQAAQTAKKGLAVMDAYAEQQGHSPAPTGLLEIVFEGRHIGIMPDGNRWKAYERDNPGVLLFTMEQAAAALIDRLDNSPAVKAAQEHFPNAQVTAVRPRTALEIELNDQIPF